MPSVRPSTNRASPAGEPKLTSVPSTSTSNTSHAPITTSATSALFAAAAAPHSSAKPAQSANERLKDVRALRTEPSLSTPQPSTEPSLIVKVPSMPSGRFTANECAWLSPTITTERGSDANVVVGASVTGTSVTAGALSVGASVATGAEDAVATGALASKSNSTTLSSRARSLSSACPMLRPSDTDRNSRAAPVNEARITRRAPGPPASAAQARP